MRWRVWLSLSYWWERWRTVPVWVGGLFPTTTVVVIDDSGEKPLRLIRGGANDEGVFEGRISRRYRRKTVRVGVRSTWFKNKDLDFGVTFYGLFVAVFMERDFFYTPSGGGGAPQTTENVPGDVLNWDAKAAFTEGDAEAKRLARSKVKVLPPILFGLAVAGVSIWVGTLNLPPLLQVFGFPALFVLVTTLARPWLDGRKEL